MTFVYQVPQATVIILQRMGRFSRVATSGLRFRLPLLDAPKVLDEWTAAVRRHGGLPILIELSEQQIDTSARTIITRDNVEMMADATVFWQIVDPVRAVYEVDNLPRSITDLAVTTLRNLLGAMTLNDALGARARINEGLLAEIDSTSRKWGVRVNRVEVQELRAANAEASGAMLQQMASEREREATVAVAEGARRARALRAEGTGAAMRILVDTDLDLFARLEPLMGKDGALRYLLTIRYFETLERIAQSPSVKLFLPGGPSPEALTALGMASDPEGAPVGAPVGGGPVGVAAKPPAR